MNTILDEQTEPTIETYKALLYAFKYFNQALFNGELPAVVFTYHRQNRVMGYASFERWIDDKGNYVDELAINPEYFAKYPLLEICQTLVHEMVHIWQTRFGKPSRRNYHNTEWANMMESIGLMPSHNGRPDGKKTGESMMDYVLVDGKFLQACVVLKRKGFFIPLKDRFPIFRPDSPTLAYDKSNNAFILNKVFTVKKALKENSDTCKTDVISSKNATISDQLNSISLESIDERIENSFYSPVTSKPMSKSGRIKYTCASCRINVWGKPGLSVSCGSCDNLPLSECE